MHRFTLTLTLGLFLAATPALGVAPPNIVVVIADDVGIDQLSCFSEACGGLCTPCGDFPNTPNICNRLTEGGVLFRNAWANPSCSPTRSTVLTGRYGFRTGVRVAGNLLPCTEVTIPEVLKDSANISLGYESALIGKWHLSGMGNCTTGLMNCAGVPEGSPLVTPATQGFDHFAGTPANIGNYNSWLRWEDSGDCPIATCAAGGGIPECVTQPYATIVNVNDALAWLTNPVPRTEPWFLYLAFNAPHSPYHKPPPDCPGGPCYGQDLDNVECALTPRLCYQAMVETLDHELGRLLDILPLNTVVVFLGDNGSPGENTPNGGVACVAHADSAKFDVWEGGIRVPLIISAPSLVTVPDAASDVLVNISDVFKTVLDLAQASIPPSIQHDSVSLVPNLIDPSATHRNYVYSETIGHRVVRDAQYKLIPEGTLYTSGVYLFDLVANPVEDPNFDLYLDEDPDLTPVEQAHFDDLNEYLDFLLGEIPACPTVRPCAPSGTCSPNPLQCTTVNTGMTACVQDGQLMQCAPGQTVRRKNCNCKAKGGSLCVQQNQTWFCQ